MGKGEQWVCIHTCAMGKGEQWVCIHTCAKGKGEQWVCIHTKTGPLILALARVGIFFPHVHIRYV